MLIRRAGIILAVKVSAVILLTGTFAGAYEIELPPQGGLNIKLLGRVTEGYSTNINFSPDEDERIEGLLTNTFIGLNLLYSGKRRELGLESRANWQIPTKVFEVSNSSQYISFNLRNDLTDYDTLAVSDYYSHSQVPESFDQEFGRRGGRFDTYENSAQIDYVREISERIAVNTGYTYTSNWYSMDWAENANQNMVNLGVSYLYSAATKFLIRYRYSNTMIEGGDGINIHSIIAGVTQYITKLIDVSVNAGGVFSSRGGVNATREHYNVAVNGDIDEETTASMSYTRGVQVSTEEGDIFDNWEVNGQVDREMFKYLNVSFSGFYGEGVFDLTGVKDKFTGASALLRYKFWENEKGASIDGRLGYTYSSVDSSAESRGYRRESIDAGISAGF